MPNFAAVAFPLTVLLATGPWKKTEATEKAFREVKALFAGPLTLYRPDPERCLILQTDACKTGMVAVLFQVGDHEERRKFSRNSRPPSNATTARMRPRAGVLVGGVGGQEISAALGRPDLHPEDRKLGHLLAGLIPRRKR
jgi:hypothetical protein